MSGAGVGHDVEMLDVTETLTSMNKNDQRWDWQCWDKASSAAAQGTPQSTAYEKKLEALSDALLHANTMLHSLRNVRCACCACSQCFRTTM
jgi:hypothetical protein